MFMQKKRVKIRQGNELLYTNATLFRTLDRNFEILEFEISMQLKTKIIHDKFNTKVIPIITTCKLASSSKYRANLGMVHTSDE